MQITVYGSYVLALGDRSRYQFFVESTLGHSVQVSMTGVESIVAFLKGLFL